MSSSAARYVGSLTRHVLESFAHHAGIALHVRVLAGRDPHHIVEAQFKALARALRAAVARTRASRASRAPRAHSRAVAGGGYDIGRRARAAPRARPYRRRRRLGPPGPRRRAT